jgi:hypothetical protein
MAAVTVRPDAAKMRIWRHQTEFDRKKFLVYIPEKSLKR